MKLYRSIRFLMKIYVFSSHNILFPNDFQWKSADLHENVLKNAQPIHEPHFQAGESQRRRCKENRNFFRVPQKVLEMCPRPAQTSPIDRKWKVELIYDGFMLRWLDRLAIGAENDRSTSDEAVEQIWRADTPQNPSESFREPPPRQGGNPEKSENFEFFALVTPRHREDAGNRSQIVSGCVRDACDALGRVSALS